MSGSLNKVQLIGNLGADPESSTLPSGSTVTNFTIATNEVWKDKQTGERHERVEWHRVTLFNRLAEIAAQYLHKGSKVYLEGSNRTRSYMTNDGIEKYVTEVIGSSMTMLDSKAESDNAGFGDSNSNNQSRPAKPAQRSNNQARRQAAPPPPPPAEYDDFDDSVPF